MSNFLIRQVIAYMKNLMYINFNNVHIISQLVVFFFLAILCNTCWKNPVSGPDLLLKEDEDRKELNSLLAILGLIDTSNSQSGSSGTVVKYVYVSNGPRGIAVLAGSD